MRPSSLRPSFSHLGLLIAAVATASCADDVSVNVKYAQGFTPGPGTVSVLGVFRDGRMSTDSWGPLSAPLSASLGGAEPCEPGFSQRLRQVNEELYVAVDDDVRDNGITEDLLTKLAPKAEGDLILAISIHGSIAPQTTPNDNTQPGPGNAPPVPQGGLGGKKSGHRGPPLVAARRGLELAASLFSIRLHQLVARLNMSYGGASTEEAIRRFATEVATILPGASCRGWKWTEKRPPASESVPPAALPSTAPAPVPALPIGP